MRPWSLSYLWLKLNEAYRATNQKFVSLGRPSTDEARSKFMDHLQVRVHAPPQAGRQACATSNDAHAKHSRCRIAADRAPLNSVQA